MLLVEIILQYAPQLLCVLVPVAIYLWFRHRSTYWQRHNVPHVPALPLFGNLKDLLTSSNTAALIFYKIYNDPSVQDAAFCGVQIFHKPGIIVRDPELVKQIMVKDFNSFSDRYGGSDVHDTLGTKNLFLLRTPLWRKMRARLSPFFSSGKIKQMFGLVADIGKELNETMLAMSAKADNKLILTEAKDFAARYTTDVIANCAYGVQANSLSNANSDFRKNGKQIFDTNWYRTIELNAVFFMPELAHLFKFRVFAKGPTEFLRNTINFVMREREQNGTRRNDLIDTLVELKNEDKNKVLSDTDVVFRGDVLVAQAAVFFTGGFETSSATMSFGLFELAKDQEIQNRLRNEIKETLEQCKGELTYDAVQHMTYMHMVVSEILRMHPILAYLERRCTLPPGQSGYSLKPFGDCTILHNMPIFIPIFAIQRDPKYFPNPNTFDPERFSSQNKHSIVPYSYLPFGAGPHNCVGERFGLLQTKIGLINILRNHRVKPSSKSPVDIVYSKKAMFLQSEGGIFVNFESDPML